MVIDSHDFRLLVISTNPIPKPLSIMWWLIGILGMYNKTWLSNDKDQQFSTKAENEIAVILRDMLI